MISKFIKKTNRNLARSLYFLQAPGGSGKTLAYCIPVL